MWVEMCILTTTEQESELGHLPFPATLPTLSLHSHPALSSSQALVGSRSPPCPSPTLLLFPMLEPFPLLLTECVLQTCNFTLHLLPRQHKGEFKVGKKSQKDSPKTLGSAPYFVPCPYKFGYAAASAMGSARNLFTPREFTDWKSKSLVFSSLRASFSHLSLPGQPRVWRLQQHPWTLLLSGAAFPASPAVPAGNGQAFGKLARVSKSLMAALSGSTALPLSLTPAADPSAQMMEHCLHPAPIPPSLLLPVTTALK